MSRETLAVTKDWVAVALSDAVVAFAGEGNAAGTLLRPQDSSSSDVVSMGFSGDGRLLVTADSEKTLRVWNVHTAECVASHKLPKKLTSVVVAPLPASAAGTSGSVEAVLVGDKTGDVWALPLPSLGQCSLLLGHTASIITGLAVFPSNTSASGGSGGVGEWTVASADRDEKVRLSVWPQASVVKGFCMGHTEYVSALIATSTTAASQGGGEGAAAAAAGVGPLVTISGDGSVRAWHPHTGACLGFLPLASPSPVASAASRDKSQGEGRGEGGGGGGASSSGASSGASSGYSGVMTGGGLVPVAVAHNPKLNLVAVATAAAAASSSESGGGCCEVKLLDLAPAAAAVTADTTATTTTTGLPNLLCVGSVQVPSAPRGLAFCPSSGRLLVLCAEAPFLHSYQACSSTEAAVGAEATAVKFEASNDSACTGMATCLASVIAEHGLSVNSALTLSDHDINPKEQDEGGGGGDEPSPTAEAEAAGAGGGGSSATTTDPGCHELRKRPIANPNFDEWNSKKRFTKTGKKSGDA